MGTFTLSLSGSGIVNGAKSYTVSDADVQRVLDWAATHYASSLPANPTNAQILGAWCQGIVDTTTHVEQNFATPSPIPPPPVQFT